MVRKVLFKKMVCEDCQREFVTLGFSKYCYGCGVERKKKKALEVKHKNEK